MEGVNEVQGKREKARPRGGRLALVLLLHHSGLRIGGAVTLARDGIVGGKFFLYTAKAGTEGGHAHCFRDTFAVELLLGGVPLERVSVLLGHQSLKVTERHYAPWVRARQEQLEADVRASWERVLGPLPETKGTPEVHEKGDLVN